MRYNKVLSTAPQGLAFSNRTSTINIPLILIPWQVSLSPEPRRIRRISTGGSWTEGRMRSRLPGTRIQRYSIYSQTRRGGYPWRTLKDWFSRISEYQRYNFKGRIQEFLRRVGFNLPKNQDLIYYCMENSKSSFTNSFLFFLFKGIRIPDVRLNRY